MGNASNTSVFTSTLSEREDLIFGTLYLVFGIMSLSGNSLLLLAAHQKRSLLKPAELFIVNLAISDLSMTVTLFPLATSSFFAHRWLFDQAVCTLYAFCGVLFGLSSLASLTVLSTVCCLKVCYPAYAEHRRVPGLPGCLDSLRRAGAVGPARGHQPGASAGLRALGRLCQVLDTLQPTGVPAAQAQLPQVPLQGQGCSPAGAAHTPVLRLPGRRAPARPGPGLQELQRCSRASQHLPQVLHCPPAARQPCPAWGPGRAGRRSCRAAGAQEHGAGDGAAHSEVLRPGHRQRGRGGPALGHRQGPALSPALPSSVPAEQLYTSQGQHSLTPMPSGSQMFHT